MHVAVIAQGHSRYLRVHIKRDSGTLYSFNVPFTCE